MPTITQNDENESTLTTISDNVNNESQEVVPWTI